MNQIDNIMALAQVFASAWALAGGRFDSGDGFEIAEQEKQALRAAIEQALAVQPKQEPVAWMCTETKVLYDHDTSEVDRFHGFKPTVPLYTTPQPQREWVGLTDEQIRQSADRCDEGQEDTEFTLAFARAIEAKLREKNGATT